MRGKICMRASCEYVPMKIPDFRMIFRSSRIQAYGCTLRTTYAGRIKFFSLESVI